MSESIFLESDSLPESEGLLIRVLRKQVKQLKREPITAILLGLIALSILYSGFDQGNFLKRACYLIAMWLCTVAIDCYVAWKPPQYEFVVRRPKREGIYTIACVILGFLFLYFRFMGPVPWLQMTNWERIAVVPLVAFTFPIAFVIIFLLLRYKPSELGIRLRDTLVALPVIAITAGTALLVAPEGLTIQKALGESGSIPAFLINGFIAAALSEEFWRLIVQTRLGALFSNRSLGWVIATVIWAFMHIPARIESVNGFWDGYFSFIAIAPIGLMWGYLTHRTKSILPSVLVHGTNLWGLQNSD